MKQSMVLIIAGIFVLGFVLPGIPQSNQTNFGGGGVTVSGAVVAGHIATFVNSGTIQDGGAGGSGTVTHTAGNLTLNCNVVGNAAADLKCSAVTTDDGTTFTTSGTGGLLINGVGAPITVTQGTMTTSNPFLNQTATWNAAGVAFTNFFSNITCTAAATASIAAGFGTAGTQWQFKYGGANCATPQMLSPNGVAASPAYAFSGSTGTGMWAVSTSICMSNGGAPAACFIATPQFRLASTGFYGWSNGTADGGTTDTTIGRISAGLVEIGSSTVAASSGSLAAASYQSRGTKFTSNAGCTESATVGGATAGQFTVGQNTACTIVITMGNTATAPNGWTCTAYDQTAVPAVAIRQTASSATTCSLLMTVATNDVITFSAIGF